MGPDEVGNRHESIQEQPVKAFGNIHLGNVG